MIGKTFKIKKPKLINILDTEYNELTCFIFVGNTISINNNNPIKLGLVKLFLNNTTFLILHKKYDYDDINPSLFNNNNININTINRLYNNITIYVLTINYGLNKITINNTIFNGKKYVLFLEKTNEEEKKKNVDHDYNIIAKNTLNSSLNTILTTPYFTIKLKYIMATIWNC